jgi:hypothetical protein
VRFYKYLEVTKTGLPWQVHKLNCCKPNILTQMAELSFSKYNMVGAAGRSGMEKMSYLDLPLAKALSSHTYMYITYGPISKWF